MGDRLSNQASFFAAHQLSGTLADIASRLDAACDPGTFIAALHSNGRVWREVASLASLAGYCVSAKDCHFMAAVAARADHGVDDHEVEAVIAINRKLAERLSKVPVPLWREWMARHAGAPIIRFGVSPDTTVSATSELAG